MKRGPCTIQRWLSRAFSAAALTLTGSESRLAAAAPLLTPAGGSSWTLPRESRAAVRAVAVVPGLTVAAVAMRFRPLVTAAEMTIATPLTDRELGKATFLFLPFDTRELSANQRTVNRAFLDLGSRLALINGVLVLFNGVRRFSRIDEWL